MKALCLYNASQTYTQTVFEHLTSFKEWSRHSWSFLHWEHLAVEDIFLSCFDAVVVHYSVRLPFDQICESTADKLASFPGLKVLFIQDEYDNTNRTKYWIKRIGFHIVFSVVPSKSLPTVYPSAEFSNVRFVSNLTGYVPAKLGRQAVGVINPPSERKLVIGYRGRPLPIRYGILGQEKVLIGKNVKAYCVRHGILHDIAWTEESRIYGADWYDFITSCKAMLGSESGSNVFDWHGDLNSKILEFKRWKWRLADETVYRSVVASHEMPGLMNQVSPRIFEMAAARTVMVLFEGSYSGVVHPDIHYIPLKKDYSNLPAVFERLRDGRFVDALADRAFADLITSGRFSYQSFVQFVDAELELAMSTVLAASKTEPLSKHVAGVCSELQYVTQTPHHASPPLAVWRYKGTGSRWLTTPVNLLRRLIFATWARIPMSVRPYIKKLLGRA